MSGFKEKNILQGILEGDNEILTLFYKENFPKVRQYVLFNSGNQEDAEDIFQDALVFVHQKLIDSKLDLTCTISTYVFAVCKNMWKNTLRKKKKFVVSEKVLEMTEDENASILESIDDNEKKFLFQKCFLKLDDTCQKMLLHFFSRKSMAEIAILMNYSEGYSRKKKFECKKKLIEIIESNHMFEELKRI